MWICKLSYFPVNALLLFPPTPIRKTRWGQGRNMVGLLVPDDAEHLKRKQGVFILTDLES